MVKHRVKYHKTNQILLIYCIMFQLIRIESDFLPIDKYRFSGGASHFTVFPLIRIDIFVISIFTERAKKIM